MFSAALWIAVCGCDGPADNDHGSSCGTGIIADLPAPTPVWTHASANSQYYAPRVVDLDNDGKLEVLITGGSETPSFGEVVALDAATGFVRWQAGAEHDLYSSPVFLDVTGDGVKDVFVGGREETFMAVDGARGQVLWRFTDTREMPNYNFFNFYTPVLVADQTGDGLPDLLMATGGDDGIPRGEARPPGHLIVVGSADGALVSAALLPDGGETYMSPVLLPDHDGTSQTILFGTGGESWAGSLWETSLSTVLSGDISSAKRLVKGTGKGMIAPPALADVDQDGQADIIVATFDGRLMVLSGATKEIIWQKTFDGFESFSTPTLGFFDKDDVPDVFVAFLQGRFPDYIGGQRVMLSGKDGSVLWQANAGDFAMASDVAIDLNGDGVDEVIFNSNTVRDPLTGRPDDQQLYLLDGAHKQARTWGTQPGGFAPGAPWVGDLDADGCVDMVLPRHSPEPGTNDGLLTRFRVAAPVPKIIRWGGYFGTMFDSIVQPRH
jgi:outer membrane protein assembly factor BamB